MIENINGEMIISGSDLTMIGWYKKGTKEKSCANCRFMSPANRFYHKNTCACRDGINEGRVVSMSKLCNRWEAKP